MRNRLAAFASASLVAAGLLATAAPAEAATPLPGSPCRLIVPAAVNIGAAVTAKVAECPVGALASSIYWRLEGPKDDTLSFSQDGGALYPTAGLTNKYGAYYVGIYRLEANASDSFCESDYSACYEIPLVANTVVAKYRTTTSLQIARSSSKGRWTTRIAAQVRRYDGYDDSAASEVTVNVYRDNKLFKTVKANPSGAVSASVADTKGTHTYKAVAVETGATWSSTSANVRK